MKEIAAQLDEAQDIPLYHEYTVGCRRAYQEMAAKPRFTLDTDRLVHAKATALHKAV